MRPCGLGSVIWVFGLLAIVLLAAGGGAVLGLVISAIISVFMHKERFTHDVIMGVIAGIPLGLVVGFIIVFVHVLYMHRCRRNGTGERRYQLVPNPAPG